MSFQFLFFSGMTLCNISLIRQVSGSSSLSSSRLCPLSKQSSLLLLLLLLFLLFFFFLLLFLFSFFLTLGHLLSGPVTAVTSHFHLFSYPSPPSAPRGLSAELFFLFSSVPTKRKKNPLLIGIHCRCVNSKKGEDVATSELVCSAHGNGKNK